MGGASFPAEDTPRLNVKELGWLDREEVHSRLLVFFRCNKLVRAAKELIARQVQTKSRDMLCLQQTFDRLDLNGDGKLCRAELERGLQLSRAALSELFGLLDASAQGRIGKLQFLAACMSRPQYCQDQVARQAFRAFDKDKDWFISR